MALPRTLMPFIAVLVLGLVAVACGDEPADRTDPDAAATQPDERPKDDDVAPERGPASSERTTAQAGGGIAIAPSVSRCLERAGFRPVEGEPVEGTIAAWRARPDVVVAIAPSAEDAPAIAGTLGTPGGPGVADGRIAAGGPVATRDAGIACLRPAVAQDR